MNILLGNSDRSELVCTNKCFGIYFVAPAPWEIVSHHHVKFKTRAARKEFQTRDDELPVDVEQFKCLFEASRYDPARPSHIDAEIRLSVMKQPSGSDVSDFFGGPVSDKPGEETTRGSVEIDGKQFEFVEMRGGANDFYCHRFACHQWSEQLWLYAKISGFHEWAFDEALNLFQIMKIGPGA